MPSTSGYVTKTVCASACDFTSVNTAINHASVKSCGCAGVVVTVTATQTFTETITLPVHNNSGWVIVQSSLVANLPAGVRVSPSSATSMPKIQSPDGNPAIIAAVQAHHYRFIGLELTYVLSGNPANYGIVALGGTWQLSDVPHHIIIDRTYIHGWDTGDVYKGIALNGAHMAVLDSYVENIHVNGADNQAINIWNGPGPYKIVNNFLEASCENFMLGGIDPWDVTTLPADIEFRRNYLFKRMSWWSGDPSYAGTPWAVKNLFELKNGQRLLVEGNLMENNWGGMGQDGYAVLFTPRNQDNHGTFDTVTDVTFRHNWIKNSTSGFSIAGPDNNFISLGTDRVLIQNVLFEPRTTDVGVPTIDFIWAGRGTTGPTDVTIEHVTITKGASYAISYLESATMVGFVAKNNIFPRDPAHSGWSCGAHSGTGCLNENFAGWVFLGNILSEINPNDVDVPYPSGNFYPTTYAGIGFTNAAAGNFRLAGGSTYKNAGTDGTDPGVDMTALNNAINGVTPALQGSATLSGKIVVQ